jgi:choline-glycine betaine transporter
MVKSAPKTSRTSGFALTLLLVTALIPLFAVAFASAGFDEVADASPFGHPGTTVVTVVIALVTVIGTLAAWRGATGGIRAAAAIAVFVAGGIVVMMALFFVVAGGTPIIFAILLLLAAVSTGMIGRAILQSPSGSQR